jgi:REP element-mobilizing transposase RayT
MNIIKMAILPNNLHVNCHPQQNPMTFITEIEKSTLRFIWKHKRPRIAKAKRAMVEVSQSSTSNCTTEL